jgi:glycogen(starch) synthase
MLGLATTVQPSVAHLNDFGHGDLPWPAPVLTVAHSCVLSWWHAVHAAPAPAPWRRYEQHVRGALRAADLVVAPSRAMLRALDRHYGKPRAARVIANGRSGHFDERRTKGAWVLSAGRVEDVGKNMVALVRAAAALPWPVCIAGADRPPHNGTEENAPAENVYMLGRLGDENLQNWLARAAIYALPASYEPFGLSVLEAALAGCALVLGDIDSLRENWDGAALFVPPRDHAALARELRRLIDDVALRERLAAQARQRAQRFTPAAMADAYARAYAEIVAGSRHATLPLAHTGEQHR